MNQREKKKQSAWSGLIFFLNDFRINFTGESGTATNQTVHALKICISLDGDFKLSTSSGVKNKICSAVIINAGVTHTIECAKSKIYLIFLLNESQEAQELRREFLYDGRGEFYDIPKILIDESLPLKKILRDYPSWDCSTASKVCDEVISGLGKIRGRELSTSSKLSDKLSKNVKLTIEYIYIEIKAQILSGKFDKRKFTPSAVGDKLKLSEDQTERLKSMFKEETGISIEHFFRDIQMLAALNLYAVKKRFRKRTPQEDELLAALDDPTLTEEERAAIVQQLNALRRNVLLGDIAESLGFSLALFGDRIKSRLGITLTDLRGKTDFYSCLETEKKLI